MAQNELDPDEPRAKLDMNGEEHIMHRFNSALFTHLGDLACYDHVFVSYEDDDSPDMGAYIFRMNEAFPALAKFMAENNFPMHLNAFEVAECDRDAYERTVLRDTGDIPDFLPDDWI